MAAYVVLLSLACYFTLQKKHGNSNVNWSSMQNYEDGSTCNDFAIAAEMISACLDYFNGHIRLHIYDTVTSPLEKNVGNLISHPM